MKFNLLTVILLFTTVSLSSSADANKIYNFPSQFDDQLNSVNYTGQVFRQLLIEELKKTMTGIQRGSYQNSQDEISESLWSYIDYNHENDSFAILAVNGEVEFELIARDLSGKKMSWTEGYVFNDIATGKQLLDKLAGNDNPLYHGKLLGWKSENIQTPQELLNYLIEKLAKNSAQADVLNIVHPSGVTELVSAAKVTDEGQDLAELIQKLLHGAISFSQIARDYLSTDLGTNKGLNAENFKKASDNKFYTHLEHHWDEAFGYFGASRNYLNYNDLQIKEGLSIDTVNWGQSKPDGSISMNTEKNFGLSVLAAKRDLGADTDFTSDIYNDFYKGRKLITEKPEGYLVEVIKLSQNIILNIEKVIAASVIHYINSTLAVMEKYGTQEYTFANHAKFWSEMKGYALAFQFNPHAKISVSDFVLFHELVGDNPVLMNQDPSEIDSYKQKLLTARDILATTYEFKEENVKNW